MLKKW